MVPIYIRDMDAAYGVQVDEVPARSLLGACKQIVQDIRRFGGVFRPDADCTQERAFQLILDDTGFYAEIVVGEAGTGEPAQPGHPRIPQ